MFKSLLKDTAIYGLTDFIFKFINFAIFPLYAFVLTVPEFGAFALITTITQLLWTFMNCGQTSALQRFYVDKNLTEMERSQVATTGFISCVVFGFVMSAAALGTTYFYRAFFMTVANLHWLYICLGILAASPYQIFYYCVTFMRINFLPWKFAFNTLLQNLLILSLSLVLALYCQFGLLGCISAITIGNFLSAFICFLNIRKAMLSSFQWNLAKKMLFFGFPFIFTDLSNWLCASLDRWMLGELASMTEVGYYSIAFKLATVLIFIINAFGLAWTPYSMKLYNDESNYRSIFSKSLTGWFFFLICVSSGLSLFGQEVLLLMTPEAYWPAAYLIPFISMGLAFHGTVLWSLSGLLIEKKTRRLIVGTWVCALFNFLLNLFLIPKYGAKGAAMACFMTYICQASYFIYCSHKVHPIPLEHKKIGTCIAIVFGVLLISSVLLSQPWNYVLIVVKVFVLICVIVVGFLTKIITFSGITRFLTRAESAS